MRERITNVGRRRSGGDVHRGLQITRHLPWPYLQIATGYLAAYVVLDWLSFVHPIAGLGITPWNPHPGLSFALILLFGRSYLPLLFIAPLLADAMVRGLPLPFWADALAALVIAAGYGCATSFLISRSIRLDVTLGSKRDLLLLIGVATVATASVATGYVGLTTALGFVAPSQFVQAMLQYWIGDMIGIIVVTPFILVLFTRRFPALSWELVIPLLVLLAALWIVMRIELYRFHLFYLLFLPVIWAAVRFGFEVVTLSLAMTQLALIVAIQWSGQSAVDVTSFQALMVFLALTGLAVGVVVSEQQRTQHRLRLHQEALARVTRVTSMGQLAATLAHELSQPLTAIGNYSRLAHQAAQSAPVGGEIRDATAKTVEQVDRAAEVVRRLRDLIRLGCSEVAILSVGLMATRVKALIRAELEQHGVALTVDCPPDLPNVAGDSLQIEQVMLNLVRNAVESIVQAGRTDGRITLSAKLGPPGYVTVDVRDNGPGFDPTFTSQAIAPFTTTKPEGMGLGLSLCQSIIEAHRGTLTLGGDAKGAVVEFTLPIAAQTSERSAQ